MLRCRSGVEPPGLAAGLRVPSCRSLSFLWLWLPMFVNQGHWLLVVTPSLELLWELRSYVWNLCKSKSWKISAASLVLSPSQPFLILSFLFFPSAPVPPCHLYPCVGDSHLCNMGPHVCWWLRCWAAFQEEWWPLFNPAASDGVGVGPLGPRPLRVPEVINSLPKAISPRVGGRMFPFPGHNSWGAY